MDNREKWKAAQIAERAMHGGTYEHGLEVYREGYRQYFERLGCTFSIPGKRIMEIGCADFPALSYCDGYEQGHIIEPMPSWMLDKQIAGKNILLHPHPAEDMCIIPVDEVWILNVYQHVIDPYKLFEYAKQCGNIVRFFEPIDLPLDPCHLHSLSLEDFRGIFGDCVKLYKSAPGVKNFHTADCAYGVWEKREKQ